MSTTVDTLWLGAFRYGMERASTYPSDLLYALEESLKGGLERCPPSYRISQIILRDIQDAKIRRVHFLSMRKREILDEMDASTVMDLLPFQQEILKDKLNTAMGPLGMTCDAVVWDLIQRLLQGIKKEPE